MPQSEREVNGLGPIGGRLKYYSPVFSIANKSRDFNYLNVNHFANSR
jgi:hypothetical protein